MAISSEEIRGDEYNRISLDLTPQELSLISMKQLQQMEKKHSKFCKITDTHDLDVLQIKELFRSFVELNANVV